jgi:hypothetical protein
MSGASFGNTDVTDAVITGCQFSCPSVFTVLFARAALFSHCSYLHIDKGIFPMNRAPIIIQGLNRDVVYLDNTVKIGHEFISKGDLIAARERHLEFIYGREVANFLIPVLYENVARV